MAAPLIVAGLAAAAKIAAKNYAKDLAKKEAAKTIAKKAATKTVTKTAPKATPASKLTKDEKYAVKFVKDVAKKGKPGDVQKVMDGLSQSTKKDFSKALTKANKGKVTAQYEQTPRAAAQAIRVKSKSTGKTAKINLN